MRATFFGGVALTAAATVVLAACPGQQYPGTQIVTFSLNARGIPGSLEACRDAGYSEIPDPDAGFTFSAIFSGSEDGTITSMTIQDFTRDATFDGVVITSPYTAPREFVRCDGGSTVDEELFVLPISLTQSRALNGDCPADPLQPGVIPVDPDGGVAPPGWNDGHFDAVRACGRLRDTIHPVLPNACPVCTMELDLTGPRL